MMRLPGRDRSSVPWPGDRPLFCSVGVLGASLAYKHRARLRIWVHSGILNAATLLCHLRPCRKAFLDDATTPTPRYQAVYKLLRRLRCDATTLEDLRANAASAEARDAFDSDHSVAKITRTWVPIEYAAEMWDGDALWICAPGVSTAKVAPTIIFLHGGLVSGRAEAELETAHQLSRAAHVRVLAVNYRLAPETPLPGATCDVLAAVRWLREELGVKRIALVGGCGGATLVLLALQRMAEEKAEAVQAGVAVSPYVDMDPTMARLPSVVDHAQRDASVSADAHRTVMTLAAPDPGSPDCNPCRGNWRGLAPLYLAAGGLEVLRDHAVIAFYAAKAAGVEVHLDLQPQLGHCFPWLARHGVAEGAEGLGALAFFLRGKLFGTHDFKLHQLPPTVADYVSRHAGAAADQGWMKKEGKRQAPPGPQDDYSI
ncbi:Alpha/Beta hydrolase protein [Pelagophyceae sp. CCMP2097]|nr:Alpha/Beta hydrolase protein [Pelagophyceae sp. CCMP2097]|mmetsp:Transcript_3986/g.14675  ORF Transcript_3986/g.14675 Transcript_3986/m.14675 type:complete len:428 (-) Transcript_3986:38-1321(-)